MVDMYNCVALIQQHLNMLQNNPIPVVLVNSIPVVLVNPIPVALLIINLLP
uniref:Uncharacterized protein n=1 Tax=Arion vulgaris TaxID=1028688 RepID=A0A0B6YKW7_9EUPU